MAAINDRALRIWQYCFGSPGSFNNLKVTDRLTSNEANVPGSFHSDVKYTVKDPEYFLQHYNANPIYPNWWIFVRTMTEGMIVNERLPASAQEDSWKDVNRLFGVFVACFHIFNRSMRLWYQEEINNVMRACDTIHNMIVESRQDLWGSVMEMLGLYGEAQLV